MYVIQLLSNSFVGPMQSPKVKASTVWLLVQRPVLSGNMNAIADSATALILLPTATRDKSYACGQLQITVCLSALNER